MACGDDDDPGTGTDSGQDSSTGGDASNTPDATTDASNNTPDASNTADGSAPDASNTGDASAQDAAADATVGSFEVSTKEGDPHVHTFTVTCSDFDLNGMVTFTAMGSGHTHDVKISAGDLDKVLAGDTIEVMTTSGGHNHTFVFSMPNGTC